MNLPSHPVWWVLVAACLIWYSTITLKIAVRGVADVRTMLANLRTEPNAIDPLPKDESPPEGDSP